VDHSRTTHIILIRHGHYTSSQQQATDFNGPLSGVGIEQAHRTGQFISEYLRARMVHKRYPKFPIYHSGVRRAAETALIISEFVPGSELCENKLFREAWPTNPLPSTNRKSIPREKLDNMVADCSRLKLVYRTTFRHLIPSDMQIEEMQLSVADQEVFHAVFNSKSTSVRIKDRYRVVVCHANVIRWIVCKALGVDPDGTWGRMRYNHCGITTLEVDSVGNVTLGFLNQVGHLGMDMMTESS
jgi:serine/threonine-protein phosphatase PGAM5